MNNIITKYLLSYNLDIFYKPDPLLIGASKKLNLETFTFEQYYEKNKNIIEYSYPINSDELNNIVKNILHGQISYVINDNDLNWLQEFDQISLKNTEILNNEKYTFNYIILKLMLIGFTKNKALDIAKSYFSYLKENKEVLSLEQFIKSINNKIKYKEYWITNKVSDYHYKEKKYLDKLLKYKLNNWFEFEYSYFEREYINICNNSFSKENYILNSTKSYLINKPKKLEEQKKYLFQAYETIIIDIINELIDEKYPRFASEPKFLTSLIDDMKSTLVSTILSWE